MDKIRKIIRFVKRLFPKTPKMKFIYAWYYKHGKINEKQALFESFHGKDVSDSSLAILQKISRSILRRMIRNEIRNLLILSD